jgi:Sulfotransferase domain
LAPLSAISAINPGLLQALTDEEQIMNPSNTSRAARPFVTVVSGLPRSGTSLMMQMLHHGGYPILTDHLRVADADNPRGYFEFKPVNETRTDARWLDQAHGKVVKMVSYYLLYDLPPQQDYRIILMRRKVEEMIASQDAMLVRYGKSTGGIDPRTLAAGFLKRLRVVEEWILRRENFRLISVDYADLIGRPREAALKVQEFLDADLDVEAMVDTVDLTLYRQRA